MIDESMDKEQMQQPPQPWEFRTKTYLAAIDHYAGWSDGESDFGLSDLYDDPLCLG